jgi:hypothetical protein
MPSHSFVGWAISSLQAPPTWGISGIAESSGGFAIEWHIHSKYPRSCSMGKWSDWLPPGLGRFHISYYCLSEKYCTSFIIITPDFWNYGGFHLFMDVDVSPTSTFRRKSSKIYVSDRHHTTDFGPKFFPTNATNMGRMPTVATRRMLNENKWDRKYQVSVGVCNTVLVWYFFKSKVIYYLVVG